MLRIDDLTYTYPGAEQPALSQVSVEIGEGEVCLLAGGSGEGKSTLLRAACGLVPHFHGGSFAGSVSVAGLDARRSGPAEIGSLVGVLFQDPETQLVMSSVRAEIELPLTNRGEPPTAVARGVEEVALALGVEHLLGRSITELSGGEKQRVALAAALVGRPRLVLLDEPISQLDPVAGDELIGLLRRLNREWETTIVIAEHRIERCLHIADRAIALHGGRIVHDGSPRSLLSWAGSAAPTLQTPGARLLSLLDVEPPPVGVREARASLRARGLLPLPSLQKRTPEGRLEGPELRQLQGLPENPKSRSRQSSKRRLLPARVRGRRDEQAPALRLKRVWHEIEDGPAILCGVDLTVAPGESVALMGRNGAGKSTLLRHAAGLMEATRGRVERSGRVALLLQNPGDYFIGETVGEEASERALSEVGLAHLAERHPRDLSGGERQRLALAIVTGDPAPSVAAALLDGSTALRDAPAASPDAPAAPRDAPAVIALDEPTRGMDRQAKADLADELRSRAKTGTAVIVATHDPEFAAACAERVVLLADGRVLADGPASDLLAGGWYFATETARILGGLDGALLPEQGAAAIRAGAPDRAKQPATAQPHAAQPDATPPNAPQERLPA